MATKIKSITRFRKTFGSHSEAAEFVKSNRQFMFVSKKGPEVTMATEVHPSHLPLQALDGWKIEHPAPVAVAC